MKVLFIASTKFDYLQDILFSGLCKILGAHNVRVVPFNFSYYLGIRRYPKNLGYTGEIRKGIASLLARKYDLVVVASAKPDTFKTYSSLIPHLNDVPTIFIDGGDRSEIGGDLERKGSMELFNNAIKKRPFDLIFKREKILGEKYNENVFPLPFGFNPDRTEDIKNTITDKQYNVSFWAVESDEIRSRALDLLENQYDCKSNGTTRNQTFEKYKRRGSFYLEELRKCKIVLNFRGGGWDTMRFWETPALGVFMISQKPQIEIPQPFTHKENIVYVDDSLKNLKETIDYYLTNEVKREEIAASGYRHLMKYHTDVKRAEYMLKILNSNIK